MDAEKLTPGHTGTALPRPGRRCYYTNIDNPASFRGPPRRTYFDSHARPLAILALISFFFCGSAALADGPICLPDSNGDGHPLFGNLEYDMMQCPPLCVANGPLAMAEGDLDGDGDLDLVIVNAAFWHADLSGDITIMLNEGDGQLVEDARYAVGEQPRSVALGDLDGDGDLDMAVANGGPYGSADSTVSVLLNSGDGTFGAAASYGVGGGPRSVALGDMNGDGALDLVVLNSVSDDVSVLLNTGAGAFASPASYSVGVVGDWTNIGYQFPVGGAALLLADLDGDGDLDLALGNGGPEGNPGSTVSVLLNNGDGTLAPRASYEVGSRPLSLAIGDLDGDGDLDLVSGNEKSGDVSVLLNNGDATFAPGVPYDANGCASTPGACAYIRSVSLGDADGDGDLDLAVGHLLDDRISVLPGNGDGTFAAEVLYSVGLQPVFAGFGELNAAGGPDLAVLAASPGEDKLVLLLNDGQGRFGSVYDTGGWPQGVVIGDFDLDGDLDLAAINSAVAGYNHVGVLFNNGDGTFAEPVLYDVAAIHSHDLTVGDLDLDGDLDFVVTNGGNGIDNTVSVLLNSGDGTFAAPVTYDVGTAPVSAVIGDLDDDGDPDLVVTNQWSDSVSVLLNNGDGTFAQQVPYACAADPFAIASGDLDGDTDLDLVVTHYYVSTTVSVLLNNGNGTFAAALSYNIELLARSCALGDLDDDGDLDLAVGFSNNPGESNVQVLLNDGTGAFADAGNYTVPGTWQTDSVAMGDLDGDGLLDLVLGNGKEDVAVLLGHGDGTFGQAVVYARLDGGYADVALGDLDGDGDLDLVVNNSNAQNVSVLLNQACRAGPVPIPGDLDGNGMVDLADMGGFVACLLAPGPPACLAADMSGDGAADGLDIPLFVQALLSP